MIRIKDRQEPEFWKQYQKAHPKDRYDDLELSEEGINVRSMLRQTLVESQHALCAYCCRRINISNAINEHIKPRNTWPDAKYSMDFENLIASCRTEDTCGSKKKNSYDEHLFVSPLQEDCMSHFRFLLNGEIEGTTDAGKYTVKLLNLNSYQLRKARAATMRACIAYQNPELIKEIYLSPNADGKLEAYSDIVLWFFDRGLFFGTGE